MRRAHGFEKTTPPARLTPTHLPLHRGGKVVRHKAAPHVRDAKHYGLFRCPDTGRAQYAYPQQCPCASKKTTPQSASLTAPLTQGSQWEAAVSRFRRYSRYRVLAIPVSVQCPCASKNPCGAAAHLNYSILIIQYSLAGAACAAGLTQICIALTGSEASWFPPQFRTGTPQ